MSVIEDVNKHRNDVKTDSFSTTVNDMLDMYKRGDLKIDPEYQRLFRWDLNRQSEYIESLLLSIPTPPIFLATNPDGKYEAIDGLQRLSTLIKFFSKEIFQEDSQQATIDNNDAEANNIKIGTLLEDGPIINSLEGYNLQTLPESLIRSLRYTRVPIIVLEKESSTQARYHVFKRLNRSGQVLSDQEVRNCTARLFGDSFPQELKDLAARPEIKGALGLAEEQEKRMAAEEYLLRLLANTYSQTPLKHSVIDFLDEFMRFASEGKFIFDQDIKSKIQKTFQIINSACSSGAFRFINKYGNPTGQFSPNLFDVISHGVFINIDSINEPQDIEWIREKITSLATGEEIRLLSGAGSNTRKKHEGRLNLGKTWFKK